MKKSGSRRNKVYCIFYLDKKNFGNIKSQLEEAGINDVKAIVPMVNVLKKTRKGKMEYSEEPVLFKTRARITPVTAHTESDNTLICTTPYHNSKSFFMVVNNSSI